MTRFAAIALLLLLVGCGSSGSGGDVVVPAAPATIDDLEAMVEDLELAMRVDLESYVDSVCVIGREYWNHNGVDPVWTEELLGKLGSELDPSSEIVTRSFLARYRVVARSQRLIEAALAADPSVMMSDVNGVVGFARTVQAWALLMVINRQFSNGLLPADMLDDPSPGNFLSYAASLQYISDLLDEGATNLTNAGAFFPFQLTQGLVSYNRPGTFRQVNRALSARVRIYLGDKGGAISGIAGSFFNINGSMNTGPCIFYDTAVRSPFYREPDEDLWTVHEDVVASMAAGDLRLPARSRPYIPAVGFFVPIALDGLVGDLQVQLAPFDTAPLKFITNAELILIYAEAQIGSDVNEALAAINRVRNAAGLGNYLGATDDASMLNEVLKQRRYQLFAEGHRWIDMRRTGKLGQIVEDRVGDVVHPEFPQPGPETLALLPWL